MTVRVRSFQLGLFDRGHDECIHRKYMLTCEQYEELLARSGGFCELCGIAGVDQLWQKLCIDHDHEIGMWAVRGLLCHQCNKRATNRPEWLPGLADYLANGWYLGLVRDLGLSLDPTPEPPIGTRATARGRSWQRVKEGWGRLNPHPHSSPSHMVTSWRWLTYEFGAHNLRIALPEGVAA